MTGRKPVGKLTKHAEMTRVVRNVAKNRNDPVWIRAQLAPHEYPPRPERPPPPHPTRPSARTKATAELASSPALSSFSDPRPSLASLFRLPRESPAYPFAAQAWSKELALQMVTHPSTPDVKIGTAPHNARLAFYGRRLLSLHFQLFLLEASRHAGPAAVVAGGGFKATRVPLRLAGAPQGQFSSEGDGTAEGLEKAVLEDAVLGRYVGYKWEVKELANWASKSGYDARGSLVQSMYGGLAHAYGAPVTQRVFFVETLPYLKPLLPTWLQAEADRQARRIVDQGGVWGPSVPVEEQEALQTPTSADQQQLEA